MVADAPPRPEQLVLVLPDGGRVPIDAAITIGRASDVTVRLDDQSVSRRHARIVLGPDGPVIEDAGSSFGTLVDGQPLAEPRRLEPGAELRLGNVLLRVERAAPAALSPVSDPGPNATIIVPIGATPDELRAASPADGSIRPRLRSGWALKRVADDPEDVRYVLRDLRSKAFLRLDEPDAQLLSLLDGRRTIAELLAEASVLLGAPGPARLARLIADCGDHGLLDGIAAAPTENGNSSELPRP